MRRYIALIRPDPEHGFAASLPDFPGLTASAEAFGALRERIAGALAAHIEGVEKRGERLPAPSSFEALMADPRHAESAAIILSVEGGAQGRGERPAEAYRGGNSNDEWPEADA
jgi:predicted RNase H-like HicB family nuclease